MRLRVTESRESVLGWWRGSTSVGDRQGRDDERGRAPVTGRQLRSVRGKCHRLQAGRSEDLSQKGTCVPFGVHGGGVDRWSNGWLVGVGANGLVGKADRGRACVATAEWR